MFRAGGYINDVKGFERHAVRTDALLCMLGAVQGWRLIGWPCPAKLRLFRGRDLALKSQRWRMQTQGKRALV